MRYNHRYHQAGRGTRRHRRLHLTSWLLLIVAIVGLAYVVGTPFELAKFSLGFLASLSRVTIAYAICLVLSVVLGLITTSSPKLEALLLPVLDLAQSFPTFALLPILLYRFGSSSLSVILILIVAMTWPLTFSIIGGINETRRNQAEAARVFGATGWKFLWYYRLPMLRPAIMTGSIVSWGEAWDTMVGAEIIAHVSGAGSFLGNLGTAGQADKLLLGFALYLLFIFAINQIVWLPLLHRYTKYQSES